MTNIIPTCSRQPQQEEQPGPARQHCRHTSFCFQVRFGSHCSRNSTTAYWPTCKCRYCSNDPRLSPCAAVTLLSGRATAAVAAISFDPRSGVRGAGRAVAGLGRSCRTVDTRPAAAETGEQSDTSTELDTSSPAHTGNPGPGASHRA